MRTWLSIGLGLGLLLGSSDRARAQDNIRTVIDKAIKAAGGAERINKVKAVQSHTKGNFHLGDKAIPFTQQVSYQWPDKFKEVLELEMDGQNFTVVTVSNGDKGWVSVAGKTTEFNDKIRAEVKEQKHLAQVSRLTTLGDKKFALSALGEVKIDGKPAMGIKVSSKGYRDVNLYFDKGSGLLVKTERRAVDIMSGGEYTEEKVFSNFRDVAGLKSAKNVVLYKDGKKLLEVEVTEVKFVDKFDDDVFAKP